MDLKKLIKNIKGPVMGYDSSRGHIIEIRSENLKDRAYYYYDTGEKVEDFEERPCAKCGRRATKEGHDACLGELPGVKYACCGHGDSGYIVFNNGIRIRGKYKINIIKHLFHLLLKYQN